MNTRRKCTRRDTDEGTTTWKTRLERVTARNIHYRCVINFHSPRIICCPGDHSYEALEMALERMANLGRPKKDWNHVLYCLWIDAAAGRTRRNYALATTGFIVRRFTWVPI